MKGHKRSQFQRGSGCFNCEVCGRSTRQTGDQCGLLMCPECYEAAGLENSILDGDETPETLASLHACYDRAVAKGGRVEGYPRSGLAP